MFFINIIDKIPNDEPPLFLLIVIAIIFFIFCLLLLFDYLLLLHFGVCILEFDQMLIIDWLMIIVL